MKITTGVIAIALAVMGFVMAGVYYLHSRQPAPPTLSGGYPETVPAATAAEPPIRYPIEKAAPQPAVKETAPLPALDASDSSLQSALAELFGTGQLDVFFNLKDLVRRAVATIDNLPRESVAPRLMIARPISGRFVTAGEPTDLTIAADNYSRYSPFVTFAAAFDAKKLVAIYVQFYPLFQQAYQDLGYPHGYFNDRLIAVIDNLLAAPDVPGPVRLVQPQLMYQFADPELEARSAGQKILIRAGSGNATVLKAKLREIRTELTGQPELRENR